MNTLPLLLLAMLALLSARGAADSPVETLVEFLAPPNSPGTGKLVVGPDGWLWGSSASGGRRGHGTIYKVKADGSAREVVADFTGTLEFPAGSDPSEALCLASDGWIWGTTHRGGKNSDGTLFKLHPASGQVITVHHFGDPVADGIVRAASSRLLDDGAGYLWGTANDQVYKVELATGKLEIVHAFLTPAASNPRNGLTADGMGHFWGSTMGGGAEGLGVIYRIGIATGEVEIMAELSSEVTGSYVIGPLTWDGIGHLWGSTSWDAAFGTGGVFKVSIATGECTAVPFATEESSWRQPSELLLAQDASLLGTNGDSSIFRIDPLTAAVSIEARLDPTRHGSPVNGLIPIGPGRYAGCYIGDSVPRFIGVYAFDAGNDEIAGIAEFNTHGSPGAPKGHSPRGGVAADAAGNLWGSTAFGASGREGTIFKRNAATGELTEPVEFTGTSGAHPGGHPLGRLVDDGLGYFWGVTLQGGAGNVGTLFKIEISSGEHTVVTEFAFDWPSGPGCSPQAGLVADGLGFLWGTNRNSGPLGGRGSVFKVNPATGEVSAVTGFTGDGGSRPGGGPRCELVPDGNGYLWGTTSDVPTVFKIEAATGAFTHVTYLRDGSPPVGLTADGAGYLWGVTFNGGANNQGTVFKIQTATGIRTWMCDTSKIQCGGPRTQLSNDGQGSLWGISDGGVFRVRPASGYVYREYYVSSWLPYRFAYPDSMLLHNGDFYGAAAAGSVFSGGSIFRLGVVPRLRAEGTETYNPETLTVDLGKKIVGRVLNWDDELIALRNLSALEPCQVGEIAVSGPDAASFQVEDTGTGSIGPALSRALKLVFRPSVTGPLVATLRIAGSDPEQAPIILQLKGTGITAAEHWRSVRFPASATAEETADDADPDGDGIVNLLERAFNLMPLDARLQYLDPHQGSWGLPTCRVLKSEEESVWRVEYLRSTARAASGLSYSLEVRTDLADGVWEESTAPETVEELDELWEWVKVDFPATGGRRFARVEVIAAP